MYIKDNINYISRQDLEIFKEKELESTFIEILNPKGKNIVVGCLYRHPCMHSSEFNETYLRDLLSKIIKEKKLVVIMGDFNIDILKYDTNKDSSYFVDALYSSFLLPYPTRITTKSSTLRPILKIFLFPRNQVTKNKPMRAAGKKFFFSFYISNIIV